jgi:hypothetical protein
MMKYLDDTVENCIKNLAGKSYKKDHLEENLRNILKNALQYRYMKQLTGVYRFH